MREEKDGERIEESKSLLSLILKALGCLLLRFSARGSSLRPLPAVSAPCQAAALRSLPGLPWLLQAVSAVIFVCVCVNILGLLMSGYTYVGMA